MDGFCCNGSMVSRVLLTALALYASAFASLVRIDVHDRSDVLDGRPFGAAGAYERISGRAFFAVDPALPANRAISDIGLAPRNEEGLVEFSADIYVLKPRDSKSGNGTILFEVLNRGNKLMMQMFNLAQGSPDPREPAHFGDAFLLEQGFTLVWLGWQWDVPALPGRMRLDAPAATESGKPITGPVRAEFVPDTRVLSFSLSDRDMVAYPVLDPLDPKLELTFRTRADGPRRAVPRRQWWFAREENGRPVPDNTHVFMSSGFEPGRIYELVYTAKDPVVAGLGPAAVRDLISFLKHGGTRTQAHVMFWAEGRFLKRAIGFGVSQSGRFLRTLLHQGFNQDEQGRPVFDGIFAHVAGAGRGSFNHRFAQPSRDGHPFMNTFYPTDIYPFTDLPQADPETGLNEGLLDRAGAPPKIFYTYSSYEYYGRAASLTHTTLDGKSDAPLAEGTRIYLFAGTQHVPAAFPPARPGTQNLANPNDFRLPMRALLAAMHEWLAAGKDPPAPQYPRIADDRLVPLGALRFPKIPGVRLPVRIHGAWRVDYGPEFRSKGIVSIEPPKVGKPFAVLVPQVDGDGNELSGIRLPDVAVPLATSTGWNLRDPALGAPDELSSMPGSWIPFARSKAEREKARDARPSIEERYASRQDYLDRVEAAARGLAGSGYLLERDIARVVEQAGKRWDHVASR